MADDSSAWLENVLGAAAGTGDEAPPDMRDARCPKCNAQDFVNVPDLLSESVARLEDASEPSNVARVGKLTDEQIVREFAPPTRSSAVAFTVGVAVPLGVGAYYVYRRFGNNVGQIAIVAAIILTAIVFMTKMRSYSDKYYRDRTRWRRMFVCRNCGQRVAG